nr:Uma2 family endonuclease [Aurantimonas sp. VKM B-3413]
MTADVFLTWLETQRERHELVNGRPVRMMAGAKQSHNVVTTNVVVALSSAAKQRGCRTTSSDTAVRTGSDGIRYPDVVVDCGPPDPDAKEALRPTLVVEISSPNTLITDATDKLDEYRMHGDIQVIMLIEPDVVSVKIYRRASGGEWEIERYEDLGSVIALPEIAADLPVANIYDTLDPKLRTRLQLVSDPDQPTEFQPSQSET